MKHDLGAHLLTRLTGHKDLTKSGKVSSPASCSGHHNNTLNRCGRLAVPEQEGELIFARTTKHVHKSEGKTKRLLGCGNTITQSYI